MELQFVKPRKAGIEWVVPTLAFELCRRKEAPFFTVCFLAGRWITRIRIYWNVPNLK